MSPRRRLSRESGTARRREARQRTVLLTAGSLAILVAFALLYVALKSPTGIPLKPYYTVSAQFRSVGTLETGADVTVAGRLVGQVVDLRTVKGVPTIDLQMNPGTKHLPVGTTARIRPRGLLGAEYIDLSPSSAQQTIRNGGVIPVADTSAAEQLTDVIAGLTAPARRNLQEMINGFGDGLLGRGPELNQTLSTAPSTMKNLTSGLNPLVQSGSTATLISGANAVTAELDAVRGDFYPGLHYGAKGLAPLQAESASVSRLLETAPADMTSIDASLSTTDTVLGHVSRFASEATRFTALAPQALRSLTDVLVQGRKPLGSAKTLLEKLQPAIAPTEKLTATLNPELPELSGLFTSLTPVLNTVAPYGCDLEGFSHNWRGFLGSGSLQSGPLGPYTQLRTEIAGPGAVIGSLSLLPATYDPTPKPCIGAGGP
jgi:virulence factor Mce-like protein